MSTKLTNPVLEINNLPTFIVPNSLSYKDGFGEQTVSTQVAGNTIQTVYSDNAESKIGFLKFSLHPTPQNVELVRGWKVNKDRNAATISGAGGFSRSFNNLAVTNDVEVNLGSDATIDVEMMGDPAI